MRQTKETTRSRNPKPILKRMTPSLVKAYRIEYENTPITMEELIAKHNLQDHKLDTTEWVKKPQALEIIEPIQAPPVPMTKQEQSSGDQIIKTRTQKLKMQILDKAQEFMDNDVDAASIADFKSIVSIVDTIDRSVTKQDNTSSNMQIVINNIMSKFADTI